MKNTFGNNLAVTVFGESHGEIIGAVLDGMPAGIPVNMEYIQERMLLRKATQPWSTGRHEPDEVIIASGVMDGKTTGTAITILIENRDVKSHEYEQFKECPRPGHGDYSSYVKYHGCNDYRGGGHGSGRLTAPIVAAGALVQYALERKGILIGSHVAECGTMKERRFSGDADELSKEIKQMNQEIFPVLDKDIRELMINYVCEAKGEKDSIGGVLETAIVGLEAGIGEPWFDSMESILGHGIFSIPGVKGVSFGEGFGFASLLGSEANDCFEMKDGKVVTRTNHNGGLNGGISNGMPIIINTVLKPTPTIGQAQETLNIRTGEMVMLEGKGRHDPAIFTRARVVVDSMAALGVADMLCSRYGNEYLRVE